MSKQEIIQRLEDKFFTDFWGGTTREHFTIHIGPFEYCYADLVNKKLEEIEPIVEKLIDNEGNFFHKGVSFNLIELYNTIREKVQ